MRHGRTRHVRHGRSRHVRTASLALAAVLVVPLLNSEPGPVTAATEQGQPERPQAAGVPVADQLDEAMAGRAGLGSEEPSPETPDRELLEALSRKAEVAVTSPKGTRVWTVSELTAHDLPLAARRAYVRAAALSRQTDPGCGLPWTLLAAIGRVESDHGRYAGARLGDDGFSRPRIIGMELNGVGPVAAIRDTDAGLLDGDRVWDRAVGPMQFIPSTWASAGRDGDGDGRVSPHDLDDAAVAAASYLCAGGGDLRDLAARDAAIYRYNQDEYYVALVGAFEVGYRTGDFALPAPTEDEVDKTDRTDRTDRTDSEKKRSKVRKVKKGDRAKPSVKPRPESKPAPKPTPKPTPPPRPTTQPTPRPAPTRPAPEPAPKPVPVEQTGVLTACEGGWCLAGALLDLGAVAEAARATRVAAGDFDQDGTVETNGIELEGLAGREVTLVVVPGEAASMEVISVNGVPLA
jgi:membrane-bound lytic murein transglycosylase B